MTREEAIEILTKSIKWFKPYTSISGTWEEAMNMAIKALNRKDNVDDYTKVLEKIIVDAEPVWICEDTPCPEWCNENCSHASIQVDCLRYLYLVKRCKYGNDQEG